MPDTVSQEVACSFYTGSVRVLTSCMNIGTTVTVDREIFVVEIFSWKGTTTKIKHTENKYVQRILILCG